MSKSINQKEVLRSKQFPCSNGYDPQQIINNLMGLNPLWLCEKMPHVFLGATLTRLGIFAAIILFSNLGLRKVLGTDLKSVAFSSHGYWWRDLIFGFLLTIIPMAVIFGIQVASGQLIVETWLWQSEPWDAFLRNIWISLLSNLDGGVGEEVLFRGYLLTGLCKAWGKRNGLIIMAVIFAVFHLFVTDAGQTNWMLFTLLLTLPGVVLGDAYLKAGSLWLPIGIHFTWDFAYDLFNLTGGSHPGLFGAVTHQVGPAWFVGTAYGIEVGLAGVLVAGFVWMGVRLWTSAQQSGFVNDPDTHPASERQGT